MAKRVKNPRTGELLPEGYDLEPNGKRIVAPDGFAYSANSRTDREEWWRDLDARAAKDMREINKPYASEEERLADINKPTAEGYTHVLAGTAPVVDGSVVSLEGVDVSGAYERAAD